MSTIVERLRRLDTCAVSDARDRLGLPDAVVTGVGNLSGTARVAGRVVTVLLGAARPGPATRHLCTSAIEAGGPDDVLVVDHQARSDCAGWGGNLSRAAKVRGIGGTLVDGAARDVDEARDLGYAVFARSSTPRTARGRTQEHGWNVPISFGGVTVRAGDFVLADTTGIVFVAAQDIDTVLAAAEDIASTEARTAAAIEDGTPVSEAMGANYERMTERHA